MAAPSGKEYGVGARYATMFELGSDGYFIPATSDPQDAYEGVQLVGAQTFNVNLPDYRRISHQGDDRVLQVDFLPPTEQATAELNVAEEDLSNLAIMTSVIVRTIGEAKMIGLATDQQGNEPDVGLLLFQQAVDESGSRRWRSYLIPKARLSPRPSGFNENPATHNIQVAMSISSAHIWGTAFSAVDDGFTESQLLIVHTQYKPKLVGFEGDGTTTVFSFPAAFQAQATTKIHGVWVNGVVQVITTDYTATTAAITFEAGSIPASGENIVVFYEYD